MRFRLRGADFSPFATKRSSLQIPRLPDIEIIRSLSVVMMLGRYLWFTVAPELFIAGNLLGV